jgi:hypothetical protein
MNVKRSLHLYSLVMLVLLCAPLYAQSNAQSDTLFKTIQSWNRPTFR